MITLITPITTPQVNSQSFDALWLSSIVINAPNPAGTISAVINTIPFNSTDGTLAPPSYGKPIFVTDVMSASLATPSIGTAMAAIFEAVNDLVISGSLYNK